MNDKQYVEASRNLAQRMLTEGGASPESRLDFAFRLATARHPSEKEAAVLAKVLNRQLEIYKANPESARQLLTVGDAKRNESLDPAEHAAYAMVANMILNLDEAVTKE
jgi:hypothetical protein